MAHLAFHSLDRRQETKRDGLNAITSVSIAGFILAILLVAADEIFDIPYHLFNAPATPINWTEIRIESIFLLVVGSLTISFLWRLNSKHEQAEERITNLNSVLKALRNVNQLIIHEKDRENLIQKSCDLMVETRGFLCAWILLFDEKRKYISAAVAGGKEMQAFSRQLEQGNYPPCVDRMLAHKDSLAVCGDITENGLDCLPKSYYGGGSGLISRLEDGGNVYGIVSVHVPLDYVLDPEEQSLFKELAGDIAFALTNIEKEEQRKRAEEALRESEERYHDLFDNANDLLQSVKPDGHFHYVNKKWREVLGYSEEEVAKLTLWDIIYPDSLPHCREAFQRVMSGEAVNRVEAVFVAKDGRLVNVEGTSSCRFEDGKPVATRGIYRDITERKKMEEQLIVTDRLASLGELASGIAHELNNPLTGVIGFADLLLERELPDDVKEDLNVINKEAKRAAQVARHLLTFARKHSQEKKLVNINSIIQGVLEFRAYEQKIQNIKVNTRLAPNLPEVMANDFQLQQVFLNIVINAEYFMLEAHGRGTLTITTQRIGKSVRASFADDGPGMSSENLSHVFDPFFTTKEVGKGTRLGLRISYGIVTEHGGRMYAESEPGKGATFIIELPLPVLRKGEQGNERS